MMLITVIQVTSRQIMSQHLVLIIKNQRKCLQIKSAFQIGRYGDVYFFRIGEL